MRCGLTVASWQFTDQLEGDGGFAVVPGSRAPPQTLPLAPALSLCLALSPPLLGASADKDNMQPPPGLIDATETHGVLHQVVAPAGSLVIFTEACLHGAQSTAFELAVLSSLHVC